MESMQPSSGNKLERWIKTRLANEKYIMNALQEYGVISDNCINAKDVGNDRDAMMWISRNFERMAKFFGLRKSEHE